MSDSKNVLDSMLKAVITRDGGNQTDTMLVNAHLAQMKMFGVRQGVEFFPSQDNLGTQRFDFIQQVIKFNKLDARLDSIWDRFLAYGKGLFYIRPTKKTYRLYWFDKDAYRTYYSPEGDLEEVIIIYPYKVKSTKGFQGVGLSTDKRYMRLRITATEIEEFHSEQEISFDTPSLEYGAFEKKTVVNSMEFIPCVEVFNNPDAFGTDGNGEFDWMANQIIAHDEMVKNIRANLSFFGNPTLLSSRPKQDIVESSDSDVAQRPSISSQSGFQSEFFLSSSTFKQDNVTRQAPGYIGKPGSGMRVPRVIANLEPTDRVGFITPNAVSTDQARYAEQLRSEIRLALGGIDDLSITNVTATEIKSAYGRVSATAKKKCLMLYTYGICRCFELMIFQEEQIFRKSLAYASGIKYPVPPEDTEDEAAVTKYEKQLATYEKKLQKALDAVIENREIPEGVLGLAPDGDRTILWRWMGPVYEDTAQDKLNQSIFTRNLQELGVDSPVQFPFQGQQYSQSQDYDQANYASQQDLQYNNWETGIYSPGINSNQEYYDDYSQTSPEITEEMLLDNGVSEESLDVIDHFGADAPALLNDYACAVEDELIATAEQLQEAIGLLQELSNEHRAYEAILTDPDILADYTCEFFGENGPYPIPDSEIGYGRPQMQAVGTQYQRPSAPERPQMPVPPQPQIQGDPTAFWNNFGALAERDPSNAWRYLNSAQQNPDVFRQKMLVMD
jgi:hypothetical protein